MSKSDKTQTISDILQSLPPELSEIAEALNPQVLQAANLYLKGCSKLTAVARCKMLDPEATITKNRQKASCIFNRAEVKEYVQAVKEYSASAMIMDLHEIDIKLSQIARTEKTEVIHYTSIPLYDLDENGEEYLIGYRTKPFLVPLEELTERQRDAIKSIKQTKHGLEVELHDPIKAMDMLIKRKGGYTENVNTNVSGDTVHAFVPKNNRGPKQ